MTDTQAVASGVQNLITRLRDEGVEAGEKQAESLIREAEARALTLVADAEREAKDLVAKGREEIARERSAGRAALKVAIRDTSLELSEELKAVFATHVRRLISAELKDRDFLKQLILTVAGRATAGIPDSQALDVLINQDSSDAGQEQNEGAEKSKEALRQFVLGVSGTMIRQGVALRPSGVTGAGIRIKLVGEDVEIDLTDKALSDLILKHLLPRYRKIVEGVD